SGSVAKRTGVSRFCQRDRPATAGKHDGVWEKSAAFVPRFGWIRLSHGDFSPKRIPRFDESERRVSACSQKKRDPKGLAQCNADARGALQTARLRSNCREMARLERLTICRRAYRSYNQRTTWVLKQNHNTARDWPG